MMGPMTGPRASTPIATRLRELYRIGPGPSSSHTVGPMRAAAWFRDAALAAGVAPARLAVELKGSLSGMKKSDVAAKVGALLAERAKTAGVSEVVFDRGPYRYHGRVKALAEAAREGGLQF